MPTAIKELLLPTLNHPEDIAAQVKIHDKF
jgi:hypothetical protein